MAVITASEAIIPAITDIARPFFQKMARPNPPRSAPLVRPRREKAALNTKSTRRLRLATRINARAHNTVEILLNRRKNDSLRSGEMRWKKSIVETEPSEVSAELTDDIAAESIATMRK